MKINEVIVVEGKNDSAHLKRFFDCDTIITFGLSLSDETIDLIRETAQKRGVILLLDPDTPGEKIRKRINEAIPGLKNAFILKKDAKTVRKVGVEHASKEVLSEALKNCITYGDGNDRIGISEMLALDLIGNRKRRLKVSDHYHLGECNAKTLRKRLNMLGTDFKELQELLDE